MPIADAGLVPHLAWADHIVFCPAASSSNLDVYRETYGRMIQDAEFVDRGRKMSDDFEPWSSGEVELLIKRLGAIPMEAIDQLSVMLRKQGLQGQ